MGGNGWGGWGGVINGEGNQWRVINGGGLMEKVN